MEAIAQQLRDLQVGKVLMNEPLANHTTMKIGGPADVLVEPSSVENVEKMMKKNHSKVEEYISILAKVLLEISQDMVLWMSDLIFQ